MLFTLIGLIISGVLFVAFFLMLLGSLTMGSMKLFYRALMILPAFLICAFITARKIFRALPKERSKEEVYNATFGKPTEKCVEVMEFFDPTIPVIDACAFIEFKACPGELSRILHGRKFTFRKELAKDFQPACSETNSVEFKAATKGDTILIFSNIDSSSARGEVLYSSIDSSFILYEEILY